MGDNEILFTLVRIRLTVIDDQGDDKCRQSGKMRETMFIGYFFISDFKSNLHILTILIFFVF